MAEPRQALVVEEHVAQTSSMTAGQNHYDWASNTSTYTPPQFNNSQTVTVHENRQMIGYTPLVINWHDGDNPKDYVTARKGDDYVVFYIRNDADVHIDFKQRPIIVTGASRVADSNRAAEAR